MIVLAVVYLPVAMTSTPSFCQNCHLMKEPAKLWEESTHANVNCVKCHVDPGVVKTLEHKALSYKEIYFNFFGKGAHARGRDARRTNEACLQCHNLDRTVSPGGDIKIPHREHVEMRDLKCADCHFNVVHTRRATPSGSAAHGCLLHVPRRQEGSERVQHVPHQPGQDLRSRRTRSTPSRTTASWPGTGAKTAAAATANVPRFCENCHSKPPAIHQLADLALHAQDRGRRPRAGDLRGMPQAGLLREVPQGAASAELEAGPSASSRKAAVTPVWSATLPASVRTATRPPESRPSRRRMVCWSGTGKDCGR